jgi:hypothetical protein
MTAGVVYSREMSVGVAEFKRVLVESGLGSTRPVDDEDRLEALISGANLIITARLVAEDGQLVVSHAASPISRGAAGAAHRRGRCSSARLPRRR